jgi:hypothetical protein
VGKDKCREFRYTKQTGSIPSDHVQRATGGRGTSKELALEQDLLPVWRPDWGERLRAVRRERQLPQMTAIGIRNEHLNLSAATSEGDEVAPR